MEKYRAVKHFTDLQDNNYAYYVGDIFPHKGLTVSEERIKELATSANKRGVPVIERCVEAESEEPESKVNKKGTDEGNKEEVKTKAKPKKGNKKG